MARERWFFALGNRRRGPLSFSQLVESLLGQPNPRGVLVWRKGLAGWTRAEDVNEVEQRLAPILAARIAEEAARRPPATPPAEAPRPRARVEEAKPGSPALVYGGIAAGVAVLGLLGWFFWPRAQTQARPAAPVPLGGTSTDNAPAVVIPVVPGATPVAPPRAAPPDAVRPAPSPAGMADRESDLPRAEVRRLKGVAAWSGDALRYTLYNGTEWRVTEVYVRIGRFQNDDLREDPEPFLLLPAGAKVDAGVADLLSKVAPDRKKAGLNPFDTGIFEGKPGPQPESFRCEIESARGYPPR